MADYGIKPDIALGIKPAPTMSLSDLLTAAKNVQAYQQAARMNPVEFEKASAERDVSVQTAPSRIRKAAIETDDAAQNLHSKVLKHYRTEIAELLKKDDVSYQDIKTAIIKTAEHTNAPLDIKENAIKTALADFGENDSPEKLRSALAGALVKTVSTENQLSARLPKPTMLDLGGNKIPVSEGNELVTGVPAGSQIGIGYKTSPQPTLMATETGMPGEFGGGNVTPISPPQNLFTSQASPAAGVPAGSKPQAATVSPAVSQVQSGFSAQGGLQLAPGETYDAYRARVAELSKLPTVAAEALNPKNVESIPNMEYTNNRIIKLLENPKLDIGPIANAIANKTGGIGLNSDQQIIKKYLEQRIRQEGSRSNQDQESQRAAFGSFANDKQALREIIYNDKTRLASDRLFNEGVRKAMGNPNKPNLGAINVFRDKFNELAGDRDLMTYIGIVGDKSIDQLTKTDTNYLKKVFGGRGDMGAVFDELEAKHKALMKLVKG